MSSSPPSPSGPETTRERIFAPVGLIADAAGIFAAISSGPAAIAFSLGFVGMIFAGVSAWQRRNASLDSRKFLSIVAVAAGAVLVVSGLAGLASSPDKSVGFDPPGSAGESTGNPAPADDTIAPQIRRATTSQTPITLTRGYSVDLDSTDPDWRVTNSSPTSEQDLGLSWALGGELYQTLAEVDHVPTFNDCRSATAYQPSIDPDDAEAGFKACIRTNKSRIGYVAVRSVSDKRRQIVLDVVVWDPPVKSN